MGIKDYVDDFRFSLEEIPEQRRKLLIGSVVGVFLLVIALVVFLVMTSGGEEIIEEPMETNVPITQEEQAEISSITDTVMSQLGNFGIDSEKINSENIMDVRFLIARQGDYRDFFVSRSTAYGKIRDQIFAGSPADIDDRVVSTWFSGYEVTNMATYRLVNNINNVNSSGYYINRGAVDYKATEVNVTFSSDINFYFQTADDTSWDGTFQITRNTFSNNTVTFTFILDDNNNWSIYSISPVDNNNVFLLASWDDPSSASYLTNKLDNPERVGTLSVDLEDVPEERRPSLISPEEQEQREDERLEQERTDRRAEREAAASSSSAASPSSSASRDGDN